MTKWTRKGTQILKNGEKVFLSGVNYAPTPCGAATFEPGVGDWFAPPWSAIWERDFPLMQAAGIDNIRTYFFWAWTPPRDMTKWEEVVKQAVKFDHKPFLDLAHQYGISVTIGIALDGGNVFDNGNPDLGKDYFNFYKATAVKLAELYGNHPAVMGFCLGNEQNNRDRIKQASFWDTFEEMAKAVKAIAPDKLSMLAMQNDNPYMFTARINDTGQTVAQRFAEIFDVWGLNIYAGMDISLNNYKRDIVDNKDTALPLIISEWGIASGKNVPDGAAGPPDGDAKARELTAEEFQDNIKTQLIPRGNAMKEHLDFVAGAQYFEWTDEWWKNGGTPIWEQNASASPDWPEEYWGLHSIAPNSRTAKQGPWDDNKKQPFPPDIITARPTVQALKEIYSQIRTMV